MTVTRILCVVFAICLPQVLFDIGGLPLAIVMLLSGMGALAIGAWRLYEEDE